MTEDGRTEDGKWKIVQCSVGPETAIANTRIYNASGMEGGLWEGRASELEFCRFEFIDIRFSHFDIFKETM